MPMDPKAERELFRAEKALGRALRTIRKDKQMTVNDVVPNTGTFFDRLTVKRIERGEEERVFLTMDCLVRLIVEGLQTGTFLIP